MSMKEHILTALREQFNRWEELLASMSDEQITAAHFDHNWSIKDVIVHLWACQQVEAYQNWKDGFLSSAFRGIARFV